MLKIEQRWLIFDDGQLIVHSASQYWHTERPPEAAVFLPVAQEPDIEWYLSVAKLEGFAAQNLRDILYQCGEHEFSLLSRAAQLSHWWQTHAYCGKCGAPNELHSHELALECSACHYLVYPRISPCIIVLITRGEQCLLARHARSKTARYSCLAGFIEAGESAEHAVRREVMEEVGITLGDLQYVRSQAWPFPSQLMLGYYADYQAGDIAVDGHEIIDAQWFSKDNLPELPPSGSISRQLIDHFFTRGS